MTGLVFTYSRFRWQLHSGLLLLYYFLNLNRPTRNTAQRSLPERAHQTTDRPATQFPSRRLHSHNSSVSTSQPLLCKPAEARVTSWQNQWEATQSNLKKYNINLKEQLPSGDTLPWRTANRVRSGQAATPAAKHLWGYRENKHCMCGAATCDLNHIMTSCTHFGEIPSKADIAEMEGRAVRWMSAVADTI